MMSVRLMKGVTHYIDSNLLSSFFLFLFFFLIVKSDYEIKYNLILITLQVYWCVLGRKAPPSHYSLKIESFSLLCKASINNFDSEEFEAGGYKWRLSIYPTGNIKGDGQNHVSIYLVLMDTRSLPVGWEVNAIINFSVYDFLNDEYLTTQDATVRRFHVLKTEWGFPKFIDLDTFKDPSNGYLIDDTCAFGVEVFVVRTMNKGDRLSMIHGPVTHSHSWKFNNFSIASSDIYESELLVWGNYKWKLHFYPNGQDEGKGNSISLYLVLDVSTLSPNTALVVDFTLRAKDQLGGKHAEEKCCRNYSKSNSHWGYPQLMALSKFIEPHLGFLVDDSCILEAELKILGLITRPID
ncbi:uncharacterized protein LOC133312234 [Gastrolobium bilobum]|uniref:uncharacterized protein LOC133312234 n=1 Tax=Gastrolobium bilobum TaxID=150636 RepID=UPI002AAFBF52|nr:uncharacterized protein LOC133312234 [Gastrolobium bilobum]